jgi:hypothetical protein
MTLIQRAAKFAEMVHDGQMRKYTDEPYIVHPEAVAGVVASVSNDANVIAAAWLHDVVEDTEVLISEIDDLFNSRVAKLVSEVTNVTTHADGNRDTRKQLERNHLARACPDAKTIKLADILDNVPSIVEHDPNFGKVYVAEKQLLLPLLREGDRTLYRKAHKLLFGIDPDIYLVCPSYAGPCLSCEKYYTGVCDHIYKFVSIEWRAAHKRQ